MAIVGAFVGTHEQDVALRLLLAVLVGAAIGLNRDLRDKSAGLRTHALVSLGAALAVVAVLDPAGGGLDALSRVVQGVLTGIGFLGAGVILRNPGQRRVRGLTTAASIWLTALFGVACGAGHYLAVGIALLLGLGVLLVGGAIERLARRWFGQTPDVDDEEPPA